MGTFTKLPEAAVVALVKEFYANAPDKSPFFAFVRGKMVSFTVQEINDYYNL